MADTKRINAKERMAFDVHVHIEHTEDATATDDASTVSFDSLDRASPERR